ncbi:MAG: hypothetical protein ACI9AD_001439 [Nitriliruptoraceae bacterium]|jgi:hypothetical protein
MTVVKLNVPPDHTPDEELALVARVAAAYAAIDPDRKVEIQVERPEEVDYRATKAAETARWG